MDHTPKDYCGVEGINSSSCRATRGNRRCCNFCPAWGSCFSIWTGWKWNRCGGPEATDNVMTKRMYLSSRWASHVVQNGNKHSFRNFSTAIQGLILFYQNNLRPLVNSPRISIVRIEKHIIQNNTSGIVFYIIVVNFLACVKPQDEWVRVIVRIEKQIIHSEIHGNHILQTNSG